MTASDDAGVPGTRPERAPRVPLAVLVEGLRARRPDEDVETRGDLAVAVSGISLSTDRVRPGDLYAALPGSRAHGASFAARAAGAGAVAVLTDPAGDAVLGEDPLPRVVVPDVRAVLGGLAAQVHDHPARALRTVAVTGTQGKTTVTRLAEAGLTGAGVAAGVVGTLGTRIAGHDVRTSLTTPEAPDLQGLLAVMRERAVRACVMEVSSHALVLGRVDGVVFDVAVFTNLGRDHLDFHADLDDYFSAKGSLFTSERARLGLVNVDDEHGRRLVPMARAAGIEVRTFSAEGADADWRAVDIEAGPDGSRFVALGPDSVRVPAAVPVAGRFNVANALAALAACAEAGFDPAAVAEGIAAGGGVPGRLERVDAGQDFTVVVDYAHKPDALEAIITTLRPLTEGRVIVVVGAGGDRDPGKRPLMGEVAARLADVLIVTDDNPRSEDPAAIRAAVLAGATGTTGTADAGRARARVLEVGDRRAAVREALRHAAAGDVVLVAGKGHETGQQVGEVVHPFDDRIVAREEIARLTAETP